MKLEHLDNWQKEILETKGHILLCTGRQVGKTTIFAAKAALRMIEQKGCKIIVVSLTEDQAQLIIIMTLDFLEKNYKTYLKKAKKPTKNQIWLNNGSYILARPVGNTGDAVRGFTGDVLIVDEASRMPEMMWAAAKPTLLTTGGEIWMCSTPFGKQGYFWECYQNKHERFKVFHINAEDVINNRLISESWTEYKKINALRHLEERKGDMSELEYAQEYLAQFVEELRRLFPEDLIEKCCVGERQGTKQYAKYYLGVDVARMGGDEIVYEVVEMQERKLIHAESIVKTKQLTTKTIKDILDINQIYKFQKLYIDDGGLGVAVFDQLLQEPATRNNVVAINNASRSLDLEDRKKKLLKEDLYMNLLRLMERGDVILLNDDKVKLSLRSVQYENIIKPNRKTMTRIFGNYTHIAEGLIRACWCVSSKSLNLWVRWN